MDSKIVEIIRQALSVSVDEYILVPDDPKVDIDEAIAKHLWATIKNELEKGEE